MTFKHVTKLVDSNIKSTFLPHTCRSLSCHSARRTPQTHPSFSHSRIPKITSQSRRFAHTRSLEIIAEDLVDLSWKAWSKLFIVAITGVCLGSFIASHGSQLLADWGVFVYEPDDEDDDDDDNDAKDQKEESEEKVAKDVATEEISQVHGMDLSSLFGDYRINVSYNWTNADGMAYAILFR